jgi:hypothetical protein
MRSKRLMPTWLRSVVLVEQQLRTAPEEPVARWRTSHLLGLARSLESVCPPALSRELAAQELRAAKAARAEF